MGISSCEKPNGVPKQVKLPVVFRRAVLERKRGSRRPGTTAEMQSEFFLLVYVPLVLGGVVSIDALLPVLRTNCAAFALHDCNAVQLGHNFVYLHHNHHNAVREACAGGMMSTAAVAIAAGNVCDPGTADSGAGAS